MVDWTVDLADQMKTPPLELMGRPDYEFRMLVFHGSRIKIMKIEFALKD